MFDRGHCALRFRYARTAIDEGLLSDIRRLQVAAAWTAEENANRREGQIVTHCTGSHDCGGSKGWEADVEELPGWLRGLVIDLYFVEAIERLVYECHCCSIHIF